jgi:hypothetical protein
MRLFLSTTVCACITSSALVGANGHHVSPLALLQLQLQEDPAKIAKVREDAKKKFLTLMHEAEEKAHHDPKVIEADRALKTAHDKFVVDSDKTKHLLGDIKARLAKGKAEITKEDSNLAKEATEIRRFTEEQNRKLEDSEKKLMQLQQKRISSFAELPLDMSSFAQVASPHIHHDGSKGQREIHAAEKALQELSENIKKRVQSLTHQLHTPGKQFEGEVVV